MFTSGVPVPSSCSVTPTFPSPLSPSLFPFHVYIILICSTELQGPKLIKTCTHPLEFSPSLLSILLPMQFSQLPLQMST